MLNRKTQIAVILASTLATSSAFAWWGEGEGHSRMKGGSYQQENCKGKKGHHMKRKFGHEQMTKLMEREFTADEIRTLQSAKLIMRDNPNLKIGEVKATKDGYSVTIVTKENSLVKELRLAKNGMTKAHYDKMVERFEAKQEKKSQ